MRGGHRVVIATDHEHQEIPDRRLADFARGADLLYTDVQYLTEEYSGQVAIGDGVRDRMSVGGIQPSMPRWRRPSKRACDCCTWAITNHIEAIWNCTTSNASPSDCFASDFSPPASWSTPVACNCARRFDVVDLRAPHKTAGDCPLFAESAEQNGDYRLLSSGFVRGS